MKRQKWNYYYSDDHEIIDDEPEPEPEIQAPQPKSAKSAFSRIPYLELHYNVEKAI